MREYQNIDDCQSLLKSEGLAVAWKDLKVSANIQTPRLFSKSINTKKKLLHGVSGSLEPGAFVAIMGSSGSGKSTLMSVLANRNPAGLEIEGTITIGGRPRGDFTKLVSGFVYQDDLFKATLTVTEHLMFAAKLRLGKHITDKARTILIENTINLLGLSKVAHIRIGTTSLGEQKLNLSGGERKRLSIATELINDPGLLFCDEPTTGLDSYIAYNVIHYLKTLTILKQKTIVCSIHAPNAQIFEQFTHIILMSQGKIVFNGTSRDSIEFFIEQGYPFHEDSNPAEYLLQNISENSATNSGINRLCDAYKESKFFTKVELFIDEEISSGKIHHSVRTNKYRGPSWSEKLYYLTHQSLLFVFRDLSVLGLTLIIKLVLAIVTGSIYYGTVTRTQNGLQSLKGILFLILSQNFFSPMHTVLNFFPSEIILFYREHSNNISTPSLFYLSSVFSLIPGAIIDPLLFTLVLFFASGVTLNLYSGILSCLATIILFNISLALGMFMSVCFKNINTADSALLPIETGAITCNSIFMKLSSLPLILQWIPSISWFQYALEIMFIVQIADVHDIACSDVPDAPCFRTGLEFLNGYEIVTSNLWLNFIKMIFLFFVFHVAAYTALLRKTKQRTSNWEKKSSSWTTGPAVAWKNLNVSAVIEKSHLFSKSEYIRKDILHGVSGAVPLETLVAILGPSGSGKSTLMSVLASRNPAGLDIDGIITIGSRPKGDFIKRISGFVYQHDLFNPTLTVMEHLRFAVKLRLGNKVSREVQLKLIDELINLLGLSKAAYTRIGSGSAEKNKANLSGGERKRLSIATELITAPVLLYCDEPTTGKLI